MTVSQSVVSTDGKTNVKPDFPVREYDGTKTILLSTRTVMGGKNPFMGIAYIVVAGVCVLMGTLFLATHLIKPRYVSRPLHSYKSLTFSQQARRPQLPLLVLGAAVQPHRGRPRMSPPAVTNLAFWANIVSSFENDISLFQ